MTSHQHDGPRSTDPLNSVVLSINAINDGDAYNVIPSTIELRKSLRTISHQSRSECLARIDRMCAGTASTYDLKVDVTYMPVSPATVNHPGCMEAATAILTRAFGAERVLESDTVMGAEDFSYMLEKLPGCFIWIGNGDSAPLHSKH